MQSRFDDALQSLLTVSGRDVLFAHWPVDPDALERAIPDPLSVDTFDGSGWVSALALENPGTVGLGPARLPASLAGPFPQLNCRTYATHRGQSGVYFLSLDSGRKAPATVGRRAFGLPFRHARMRLTRRGDEVTFRSYRREDDGPATFAARYRPHGPTYRAPEGSLAAFCVEHVHYFLPAPEDRRPGPLRTDGADDLYLGTISRDPWELRDVTAGVRRITLFEALDLPAPTGDPVFHYSPGFEMDVEPMERRPLGEREA